MNRSLVYSEILLLYFLVLSTFESVQSPPKIFKQPPVEEITFQNKESLILQCEAEGKPTPKYRWTKNGQNFDWSNNSTPITQKDGYGTLHFTKPTIKDEGQYQCFASNSLGTATSNSVTVVKAELKQFKEKPVANIEAQEGKPFQLFCDAPNGWPKPIVSWVKKYQELDTFFTIVDHRMTVDPNGTLWISYLKKNDTSDGFTYTCKEIYGFTIIFGNEIKLNVIESLGSHNKEPPIQQYVTRKNETVVLGKTAELFCIYGGFPLPQIVWFKNGSSVQTNTRVKIQDYGKSLLISNVTIEDKGTYTCNVENGIGPIQSYDIELDVTVAPYFTISPEIVEKEPGETAVIRCNADGNPNPNINWIYNGRPLSDAPPNSRRSVTPNSVTITALTEKDIGNYGCNATNSVGYVYKDVYINILTYAPTITEFSHNEETVDGNFVVLKCRNLGSPKPHVKWTKDKTELTDRRYLTCDNGDLQISQVNLADTGYYTCTVYNSYGTANATGKLSIKERTQITSKPEDNVAFGGSTATFYCKATADRSLNLTIEWLANGVPIHFDSESRFSKNDDFSMTITKIIESDSKIYTCLAKTELDNVSASAKLIIQDKPNKPQLLNITCYNREAVVRWQSIEYNHAPITHYIVEYNTSFAPDTWSVASSDIPASNQTYTALMSPWTNYTFRVIAINKFGKSIPSLHSHVCSSPPDVPYNNPENVEVFGTEPTNLVISWTPMPKIKHNGPSLRYKIYWKQDKPDEVWNSEEIIDYNEKEFVVKNQPSYQQYKVKVVAFNEVGESREIQKQVFGYSGEGIPIDAPQNLTVLNITGSRSAILSWQPVSPESVKGNLKGYKIHFWTIINGEKNMTEEKVSPNLRRTEIKRFSPNSTNYIHILAYNNHFNGPPSQIVQFDTYKEGDDIDGRSNSENNELFIINTASLEFYIGTLFFLIFVILFITICVIKCNKRNKKFVFKPGDMSDFHNFSRQQHFNESYRLLVDANRSKSEKNSEKHDTVSMKELDETDLEGMTEDGSFIGMYRL